MDSIANFIIQLKNAGNAGLPSVIVPHSKVVAAIATALEKYGYVKSVSVKGKGTIKSLEVEVAYAADKPRITNVSRVSKLSRRVYGKAKDIRRVRSGFGLTMLSTPKGILSDMEAKKQRLGGEILFKIW